VKKTLKIISALLISAGLILGTTAIPASAQPGCVTQEEFNKVKNGMKKKKVAKLFGTKGELFSAAGKGRYAIELRNYTTCTEYGSVSVGYIGGKVESKTGFFM
jgi:hypothetical protein